MKVWLTHGKSALIDDEDFALISEHRWRFKLNTGYAERSQYDRDAKKIRTVLMHRVINKTPQGMHTDHINRNKLDNRKSNLETVTSRENTLRGISPPALNSTKTECMRGHGFTPDNTYTTLSGKRNCKQCKRENWMKHYYLRKSIGNK